MSTGTLTNDWITKSAKILFRGTSPPNPNKFRVGLCNTAVLTRASTISDFISAELLPINGYSRVAANFADGAYDTTDQRHELPIISASFAATAGSLQFQAVFLIADSAAIASQVFTNANVNPTSDRITIANHSLVNGDQLVFTADSLGSLPGGIAANTIYTVASASANDFLLQGVDITDTGSGTFRARNANGSIVAFGIEPNPITLADGQPYIYQIPLVVLNTGYVNGT